MVVDRLVGFISKALATSTAQNTTFPFEDRSYLTKLFILEDFDFVIHD